MDAGLMYPTGGGNAIGFCASEGVKLVFAPHD
jgi:hypothetical protein